MFYFRDSHDMTDSQQRQQYDTLRENQQLEVQRQESQHQEQITDLFLKFEKEWEKNPRETGKNINH